MLKENLKRAKEIETAISNLVEHKKGIEEIMNSNELTASITLVNNYNTAIILRQSFMLIPVKKNIELYVDNINKAIAELEEEFTRL